MSTTHLLITFGACLIITFSIGLSGTGIGYKERFVIIKNETLFLRMFMGALMCTSIASFCLATWIFYQFLLLHNIII